MGHWYVTLSGHPHDLRALSQVPAKVWRLSHENDSFRLTAVEFDALSDSNAVRAAAERLISILNAIMPLATGEFQDVSVAHVVSVRDDGNEDVFLQVSDTLHAYLRASATVEVSGKSVDKPAEQFLRVATWVELANADKNVGEALRILGTRDRSPFNLYKLFEIIRDDMGGTKALISTGWVTSNSISTFTGSVNRPDVLGPEARHARATGGAPRRRMNLAEAQLFLMSLLAHWLDNKATTHAS